MRSTMLVLGILGGVIPAAAQSPAPPSYSETVVVTASLEEEDQTRLPASVDVVLEPEIEARQTTAVSDLLATLPATSVVRSGSPGQVTSLFTRGTESDHTLVLWNGIELNDPYFGGFNWAFLATDGLERLEVVRGPFSSLYGADALGGVVQVLSGQSSGAKLNLEFGDDNYRRGGLSAGSKIGSVHLDVAGHIRRGDGQVENDFFDGEDLMVHADWELRTGMHLGLFLRGADAETGVPYSGGQVSPNRQIAWQERLVGVPFRFETGRWKLSTQLSGVFYENRFRDPDDPFGFTASDTESDALRGRAVASYHFNERSWVAFGVDGDESDVRSSSVFGTDLAGEGQSNWAAFSEAYYGLGKLGLDLGLRYDENDAFGSKTSPRLGLHYAVTGKTRFWGSYGEGYRAPSVGELFFPVSGNPDLKPETSQSIEVGFDHRHENWSFGLTGFDNDLTDLIDFDFATFRNINIGHAETRGIEAKIGLVSDRWTMRWNGTYLETEDVDTGEPLLRRPDESSNLVLTYVPEAWSVTATGRYVGDRDDIDPITFERRVNESYLRIDLAGKWQATRFLAPYARLENLTDEEYQEALGFPAPGLTLIGGVSLTYN